MLKKPLFVSIFILLFIGLSDYSYGCHKPGSNDQKGCDDSNFFTPFVVYFDDWEGDAIQSDRFGWDPPLLRDPELAEFPPSSYINEEESVGVGLTDEGHGGQRV